MMMQLFVMTMMHYLLLILITWPVSAHIGFKYVIKNSVVLAAFMDENNVVEKCLLNMFHGAKGKDFYIGYMKHLC